MTPPEIQIEVFGKTDVGLIRDHNEDNFLVADLGGALKRSELEAPERMALGAQGALLLVCDGMGGAAAGEVASQMAVDSIYEVLAASSSALVASAGVPAAAAGAPDAAAATAEPQRQQQPPPHQPWSRDAFARHLRHAIEVANDRIFQQSRDNQSERGMGTTCTAAALIDDSLVVAQIGDSRCYVLRGQQLGQVTKDQSLAWQLIEAGAMTPEEAKAFEHANIILQALGVQDRVEVVLSQVTLRRGDVVLLCSDGLHGPVTDEEIRDVLLSGPDLRQASEGLLQKALERDGPDNITVVVARFDGAGLREPSADERVGFQGYDPGRDPTLETDLTPMPDGGGPIPGGRLGPGAALAEAAGGPGATDVAGADDDQLDAVAAAEAGTGDAAAPGRAAGAARRKRDAAAAATSSGRSGRSVVALFFVALLAAAAGGTFVLKCEREQAVRSEGPGVGR